MSPPPVEESVAVNVVPLVDIMFLLLLFLMVGGDMSHRESTELMLPKADMCAPADREAEGKTYLVINIHPVKDATNDSERLAPWFREPTNWQFAIGGVEYPEYFALVDKLTEVAAAYPEDKPLEGTKDKYLSKVFVTIRADKDSPYGMIQQAMQACSVALLYKIEVGAAKPPTN